MLLVVLVTQMYQEHSLFSSTQYNELRSWVEAEVEPNESIYIYGYEALNLPKSTVALNKERNILNEGLSGALEQGESYTSRHIRLWEERSKLELMNMLNYEVDFGYSYFGFNAYPPALVEEEGGVRNFEYILVQEHFNLEGSEELKKYELTEILAEDFEEVANLSGPGGGGYGLAYTAYRRR